MFVTPAAAITASSAGAGRQEQIDGDQQLEARQAVGGEAADGAQQQIEDVEQEAGDARAGRSIASGGTPARTAPPAGSRRRSPTRCGRRRRAGSAAWSSAGGSHKCQSATPASLCPGDPHAVNRWHGALHRCGTRPGATASGVPASACGWPCERRYPPSISSRSISSSSQRSSAAASCAWVARERLAGLRERLPVAGIEAGVGQALLQPAHARLAARRSAPGRVSSACFSLKLRRRLAVLAGAAAAASAARAAGLGLRRLLGAGEVGAALRQHVGVAAGVLDPAAVALRHQHRS